MHVLRHGHGVAASHPDQGGEVVPSSTGPRKAAPSWTRPRCQKQREGEITDVSVVSSPQLGSVRPRTTSGEEVKKLTRDVKSIAVGVFLGLMAFRLLEMALRSLGGSMQLPVLLVILAAVVLLIVATNRGRPLRWRR